MLYASYRLSFLWSAAIYYWNLDIFNFEEVETDLCLIDFTLNPILGRQRIIKDFIDFQNIINNRDLYPKSLTTQIL